MIDPFYGEFLLHPSPLECSGNTCSHNCCYCFSNIRRSCRYSNIKQTLTQLKNFQSSNTYKNTLIKEKYSICLSNRTDPFSKTNYIETLSMLEYLKNLENGIFFQTKGGYGIDEAFDILKDKKNILFYVTITSKNNDILKVIEPNSPSYEEKIELIKKAKNNGYNVIVAFNPVVKNWLPEKDFYDIVSDVNKIGVKNFIFQKLYLSKNDIKGFTEDRKKRFEDEILIDAVKKTSENQYYLQSLVVELIKRGNNAVAFGMPFKTDLFKDIRSTLGKCFPSNYDVINYCFDNKVKQITFNDYKKVLNENQNDLFNKEFKGLSTYIFRIARQVWKGNDKIQSVRTINDVLNAYWNYKQISGSLQNNKLFSVAQEKDDENNLILNFNNGNY